MRAYPVPLVLMIAGCIGGPPLPEITPWSPPRPQTCQAQEPVGALHLLVDSTALARRAAALELADGTLLMSVSVDSGEVRRVRPIESSLTDDDSFRLEAAIAEAVTPPPEAVVRGRLVARVRDGALDSLALGAWQTCRPAPANADRVAEYLERAHAWFRVTGEARIKMFVDGSGRVTEVELARSSGVPALDEHFLLVARSVEFHPARIDRKPVGVWVAMTFRVEEGSD